MKQLILRLISLSVFLFVTACGQAAKKPGSSDTPATDPQVKIECYDADKMYKRCKDQEGLYESSLRLARSQNKLLMLVVGYERCQWCESILKVFHFSEFASEIQKNYVIQPIAYSEIYVSGKMLVSKLAAEFKQPEIEKFEMPYLLIINPKTRAHTFQKLLDFERNMLETRNTPKYLGYDAKRVKDQLNLVKLGLTK